MATMRPAPQYEPPQPPLAKDIDAYLLAGVLFYSAVRSFSTLNLILLSSLSALVLLLNSFYLHKPFHKPSFLLALCTASLPLYRSQAYVTLLRTIRYLPSAPFLILEALIGAALIGNFIRLAIFRPLSNARKARRQTAPIPVQRTVPPEVIRHEWQEAARTQAAQESAPTEPSPSNIPQQIQQTGSEQSLTTDVQTPSQPTLASADDAPQAVQDVHSTSTTAPATGSSTKQPGSATPQGGPSLAPDKPTLPRRRKRLTKSQVVAAQIMRQRDAEAAARRAAAQRVQEAARLASESARAAREQRQREREQLQENVREATRSVTEAKEKLRVKNLEATKAREERRRAADQHTVSPVEAHEKALDRACEESARIEMEEQKALDDVNAAQARLIDLRNQLNRFSMR